MSSGGTFAITNDNVMKDHSSFSDTPWYGQKSSIRKVVIQGGVTRIGKYAFYDCASLTSVVIPNSVTSIGSWAFAYCRSLSTINFKGTEGQRNAISKGYDWNYGTGYYTVNYLG